jgi:hypothetical protein
VTSFEEADRDEIHGAEITYCPQGHEYTLEITCLDRETKNVGRAGGNNSESDTLHMVQKRLNKNELGVQEKRRRTRKATNLRPDTHHTWKTIDLALGAEKAQA